MKTALEWMKETGGIVGSVCIERIQADALKWALAVADEDITGRLWENEVAKKVNELEKGTK